MIVFDHDIISGKLTEFSMAEIFQTFTLKKVNKQGKSEGFDSCDPPSILLKLDSNHLFCILYDLEIRWMTSKNNRAPLLGYTKLYALFQSH